MYIGDIVLYEEKLWIVIGIDSDYDGERLKLLPYVTANVETILRENVFKVEGYDRWKL